MHYTPLLLQYPDNCMHIGERQPQINGLQLEPNMSMSVYVTGVNSPQDFTVQPTGTELISMMEDIG